MKKNATFETLEKVEFSLIVEAFNQSFSNYFVPIKFTEEKLLEKFNAEGVNLKLSVGVFDNHKLVAFILHFDHGDGNVIYNGGTGVLPEHRGKGLTEKMYQFFFDNLAGSGSEYLRLEVLTQNIQAQKVYNKIGFKTFRELACVRGYLNSESGNQQNDISIMLISDYNWPLFESFWDFEPSWQNSTETMKTLKIRISA